MKKLLGLFLGFALTFVFITDASALTAYTYDTFTAGNGYGTIEKVSDNITNVKGVYDEGMGMYVGPFSKASTAKLADGITEETYVEVDFDKLATSEFYEISLALKDADNSYVTEAIMMSQKTSDNEVTVTSGISKDFKASITESGIYTYQWKITTSEGKTYVTLSVLKGDEVIGTTGEVDFDTITTTDTKNPIAEQNDVSVKYLWFCNVNVAEGINVYAELPVSEEETTEVTESTEATNTETNPKTSDGIAILGIALTVSTLGVCIARKKLA